MHAGVLADGGDLDLLAARPHGHDARAQAPCLARAEGEVGALLVGPGIGLEVEVLAQYDGSPIGTRLDRPGTAQAPIAAAKRDVVDGRSGRGRAGSRGRFFSRVPFKQLAQVSVRPSTAVTSPPWPQRGRSWVIAMRSP